MRTTKKVSLLAWNFNKAIHDSRQTFINNYFYGIESILDLMYIDGWIYGYKKYEKEACVEIFLKYDLLEKPVITKVKNIIKPSLIPIIRLFELAADSKNTAHSGIVRTARYGFLHSRIAIKKKVGGIYLAKIF